MAAEEKIGIVIDYFAKLGVAAIRLTEGGLNVGERIHIKGHTTDLLQPVESLQFDHKPVARAERGTEVAVRVRERVRKHDQVLRVTGE